MEEAAIANADLAPRRMATLRVAFVSSGYWWEVVQVEPTLGSVMAQAELWTPS
jgi:hypothetical protein